VEIFVQLGQSVQPGAKLMKIAGVD
jgi:biotin carboxyl carrier protein